MDDVYDNLENYDDLNKIDELKNENKQLKYKIEEYTSAIDKLQKDFDNLAAEHKKLEQNYSSLLKTAKAEIERKTHMIKDLNMEKDKLVINARQNQHRTSFNKFKREIHNKSKIDRKSDSTNLHGKSEQVEVIKQIPQKDSKKDVQLPSADSLPNCNDDVIEAGNNLRSRNVNSEDRSCTSKENDTQLLNKLSNRNTDTVVKKIMNRRKSMPVLSHDMKFSSDEECENSDLREEHKMRYKSRDETLKHLERTSCYNKVSETSSTENNFPHHQKSVPGNYTINKSNVYYNNDKYKSRDQYLSSQRQRGNYSPDTYHRGGREYKDDYYQRYDNDKQRAHGSPPREKSYHHSRSRDRRSNYNRDYSRDFFRSRNDKDRYAEKYKHQIDVEEPSCKRQKIDYGYRHMHEDRWQKEIDFNKPPLSTPLEYTEHFSCQSPDFVHSDHFTYVPIREIKNTAIMHLEDPRISSRKYKIINDNDKEVLATVIGRNVDIIPVDKIVWGFKPIPMPKALLEPPSDAVIKFEKHIETRPDKQSSNTSVESGEILDHASERHQLQDCEASDNSKNSGKDYCVIEPDVKECKLTEVETIIQNNDNNIDEQLNSQANKKTNMNKMCSKALSSAYRIPKLQDSAETSTNNTKTNVNNEKCNNVREIDSVDIPHTLRNSSDSKSMPQLTTFSKYSESENKYNDIATSTKIVEADLVLSDDASDVEPQQQQTCKKQTKAKCKKNKIDHTEKKSNKLDPNKCANSSKVRNENIKVIENNEKRPYVDNNKIKATEKSLGHVKRTRKKAEDRETNDVNKSKVTKIRKSKKEEENKTEEIKAKFGDLFGDSNSLITPDDLGIVLKEPRAKDKFVTIFENTQDAVDLNFKEMEEAMSDIDNSRNDSVKDQSHSIPTYTNCVTNREGNCDDHILKNKLTTKETRSNEIKTDFNVYENLSVTDTVKTIIISTGRQPQFDTRNEIEHPHLTDIASVGKVVKPFEVLKALATSTPAKPVQHEQTDTLIPDFSNTNSTNSMVDNLSHKVDHFPDKDHLKDPDVPDVRIFVKRRRKAKKVTP